ncbi:metallophosphoesterase family protein [Marinilactibacillus piezotolerans]|uniref:metallophosphoesterase family protein n=1 Tax=Marinilactibacillus piezotolerans TaxID=258723 RepID=UPI0009B0F6C3|nr:DNA repair exonuclease [Marinilactibacillus piezotolerans]
MIRFIHAADLHLDSPFSGLKELPKQLLAAIQQSTFQSLGRLVDAAIHNQVDFVLLSGDIYDLEDRSVKAQVRFKREMERLQAVDIPVIMIHGNHDFIGNETLHLSLPDNVRILGTSVETIRLTTKNSQAAAISGFSYGKRWVTDRMIADYPKRADQVDFHIGLLHGYQEGLNSEHAHYAPFTINELREKQYDYWALGHIHTREKVAEFPLAYYPGNLQGRNKKETGEKGFLMVELEKQSGAQVAFIPSAPILWERVVVDVLQTSTMDEYYRKIQEALPKKTSYNYLVSLEVLVSEEIEESLLRKISRPDFIEAHQQVNQDQFIWITDYTVTSSKNGDQKMDLSALFPEAWTMVLEDVTKESVFSDITADFFEQSKYASLLKERTDFYREELIKQALSELNMRPEIRGAENSDH